MSQALAAELEIDSAITLNQAGVGCDLRIRLLNGPACERLRDMGFCEQLQVRKLAGGRNLICSVCGTRMAISRELAEQVLVAPVFRGA
ncbi:MAG: ferrous iron transport protein A [Akkermansiaceae bacterium]|jgi:Fe2+ transport system protein FeoA|nr:ferrous iron transport protein A [Akkermansiaceae bacterium]